MPILKQNSSRRRSRKKKGGELTGDINIALKKSNASFTQRIEIVTDLNKKAEKGEKITEDTLDDLFDKYDVHENVRRDVKDEVDGSWVWQ